MLMRTTSCCRSFFDASSFKSSVASPIFGPTKLPLPPSQVTTDCRIIISSSSSSGSSRQRRLDSIQLAVRPFIYIHLLAQFQLLQLEQQQRYNSHHQQLARSTRSEIRLSDLTLLGSLCTASRPRTQASNNNDSSDQRAYRRRRTCPTPPAV